MVVGLCFRRDRRRGERRALGMGLSVQQDKLGPWWNRRCCRQTSNRVWTRSSGEPGREAPVVQAAAGRVGASEQAALQDPRPQLAHGDQLGMTPAGAEHRPPRVPARSCPGRPGCRCCSCCCSTVALHVRRPPWRSPLPGVAPSGAQAAMPGSLESQASGFYEGV